MNIINSESRPLISVIIPVFNAEKYLEKCFRSLYNQTLRPEYFEIIFVDDGSTDRSLYLMKKFLKRRNNIRIIKNRENIGAGLSRNKAIRKAKGKYVYFLDADDYIDPITLEKLLMIVYTNNADIVISRYFRIGENGEVLRQEKAFDHDTMSKVDLIKSVLSFDLLPIIGGRFVKRSLFIENGIYFKEGLHEDVLINFLLFFYAKTVFFTNEVLYYWIVHKNASSGYISEKHIEGLLSGLLDRYNFLFKYTDTGFFRQMLEPTYRGFFSQIENLLKAIYRYESRNLENRENLYCYLFNSIRDSYILKDIITNKAYKEELGYKFFQVFDENVNVDNASIMTDWLLKQNLSDVKEEKKYQKAVPSKGSSLADILIKYFKNFSLICSKMVKFSKRVFTYKGSLLDKVKYFFRSIRKYLMKLKNRNKKTEIKYSSQINFDVIFFCEADYHIRNASSIIRLLKDSGIRACLIDFTKFLGSGQRQLTEDEKKSYKDVPLFDYSKDIYSLINLSRVEVGIFFNDWGINNQYIRELQRLGIKTLAINEGVNDFLKLSEGFLIKISPYRTCEYVILPGEYDTQFFKDRPDQYFVSGLPMIRKLYKEKVTFPKKPLAVINVNFTYGVLTWYRNLFVKTAIEGCKLAGVDYVITQHPMDNADLSEYNVTDKNMYDTIRGGSIFISRFSGAIIEALAMGKPCVYHNPHNEQMLKFQEPMGAYSISDSAQSLAKAIKYELDRSSKTPVREYSRKFMEYHANIGEKKEPAELITETIIKLMKS